MWQNRIFQKQIFPLHIWYHACIYLQTIYLVFNYKWCITLIAWLTPINNSNFEWMIATDACKNIIYMHVKALWNLYGLPGCGTSYFVDLFAKADATKIWFQNGRCAVCEGNSHPLLVNPLYTSLLSCLVYESPVKFLAQFKSLGNFLFICS